MDRGIGRSLAAERRLFWLFRFFSQVAMGPSDLTAGEARSCSVTTMVIAIDLDPPWAYSTPLRARTMWKRSINDAYRGSSPVVGDSGGNGREDGGARSSSRKEQIMCDANHRQSCGDVVEKRRTAWRGAMRDRAELALWSKSKSKVERQLGRI